MRPKWLPLALCLGLVVAATGLVACGSSGSATPRLSAGQQYYVSLGDSYAAGNQATGPHTSHNTRDGFAYQVPGLAASKGYHLVLVNFACGGASTSSMLTAKGCPAASRGPGEADYPNETQVAAAVAFLQRHRGQVGLITVSVGVNDVTPCAVSESVPCLTEAVAKLKANLESLLAQVRTAAGADVPIVGTTYPDVLLADYLSSKSSDRGLVEISIVGFRSILNPALEAAYKTVGASFVDVTAASGAYGPLTTTTKLAPYGVIPVPVARVCELTYMCQYRNLHPTTAGYRLIADLIVGALPPR